MSVSKDEARALGFDVDLLTDRVARSLEGTLTWDVPEADAFVRSPTGYDATTNMTVASTITGYHHVRLDPDSCRDGVCTRGGVSVTQSECADHLELDTRVELRTEDAAVEATLTGYVIQGRPGESFERPAGSAWVDLAEVRGTLVLAPRGAEDAQLRTALLRTDLYFVPDPDSEHEAEGDLNLWLEYSRGDGSGLEVWPMHGAWHVPAP